MCLPLLRLHSSISVSAVAAHHSLQKENNNEGRVRRQSSQNSDELLAIRTSQSTKNMSERPINQYNHERPKTSISVTMSKGNILSAAESVVGRSGFCGQ
jgi:hypothetical protein